jgi:FixJ family two-component response regulator
MRVMEHLRSSHAMAEVHPAAITSLGSHPHELVIDPAVVVDDESTLRRLAERMLSRIGLRSVSLEDGSELAGAIKPDTGIVLLDIVMKRSDGVQVRELQRSNG